MLSSFQDKSGPDGSNQWNWNQMNQPPMGYGPPMGPPGLMGPPPGMGPPGPYPPSLLMGPPGPYGPGGENARVINNVLTPVVYILDIYQTLLWVDFCLIY